MRYALIFALLCPALSQAEVVRFEILEREDFAGGQKFGKVGAYERIVGRVYYAIDPKLRQNRAIVDIDLAPQNTKGLVEFFGDLFILAPKDRSRSNGALLYDVNNRGNKTALGFFNSGGGGNNPDSAGDGFLFRHGFTLVWSGWDAELLPGNHRLRLSVPVVKSEPPVTGLVRCEIVPDRNKTKSVINWGNHGTYRPTAQGLKTATLTHRVRPHDPRISIPRNEWSLTLREIESDSPSQLPEVSLELLSGMKRGHIYELIYEARDPLVHGVCFAGLRDLISSFKNGTGKNNPLLRSGTAFVKRAHGFGISQSGRFLREFLYSGFNEDETGKKAFDGLIPHVAGGGLGSFNHRFAQPTRHVTQHDHHDYIADRFPFSYETQTDPHSGQSDGILKRSVATRTQPFVFHTQSTAEYWTRSGSLPHTDPLGRRDSLPPENVRFYTFGGTQHGPAGFPPRRSTGQNVSNPADFRPFMRALLLALDAWSRDGTPAPASVRPTIGANTLVDWQHESSGFPKIPGVRYPDVIQEPHRLNLGPRWEAERIIDQQPPAEGKNYRVLVPACDADGNNLGCLRPPEVAVPLGTYTGWNLRRADAGAENELVSLQGSFIPFARTRKERESAKDPRPSVLERYATLDVYIVKLGQECRRLQAAGFLLEEDVVRILRREQRRHASLFDLED